MPKIVTKILLLLLFLAGTSRLHAQSSNKVWFVLWNGKPTPSSDVAVQNLTTAGTASTITSANTLVSQTNFASFNSPYDIAVDPAMGKAYVLDNNLQGGSPAFIYSFNIAGTPAQIAASAQAIYTMPILSADINANTNPIITGITLDPTNHILYFSQFDSVVSSNSYIGRMSLTNSLQTDVFASSANSPTFQTLYSGQVPGLGPIAVDRTNLFIGAFNPLNGNDGVFYAPLTGTGVFSPVFTVSTLDTTFPNGFVSGVASYPQSNIVYYLTFNAGPVNNNYNLSQNAIYMFNTSTRIRTLLASGFQGYPNNIALDPANKRYYFTVGQDGTGNISPTNYQAIYTGVIGLTNAPTQLYVPALSGLDVAGGPNAGGVSLQGIWVQDISSVNLPPVAGVVSINVQKNLAATLPVANLVTHDTDPNGGSLSITAVNNTSTNGGSVVLNGGYVVYTPVSNFTGKDQFTYTLTDSEGGQAQGTITVNVLSLNLPGQNFLKITTVPGGQLLLFYGIASQLYVFQYENTVTGPWIDFSPSLTAPTSGVIEYDDLMAPSPTRIRAYRVRTGP
jgi:hypothetical protein